MSGDGEDRDLGALRDLSQVGGEAAAACPDADRLAAFAERRLPPALAATVEGHVANCVDCGDDVAALRRRERGARSRLLRLPLPLRRAAIGVAAALLAGVALFAWSMRPVDLDGALLEGEVAVVWREVADALPAEMRADLDPLGGLDGAARLAAARREAVVRGELPLLVAVGPQGNVLDPPSQVAWRCRSAVERLRLLDQEGRTLFEAAPPSANPAPDGTLRCALPPSLAFAPDVLYRFTLASGELEVTGTFRVLRPEEVRRLAARREVAAAALEDHPLVARYVLALLDDAAGLREAARAGLAALAADHPGVALFADALRAEELRMRLVNP